MQREPGAVTGYRLYCCLMLLIGLVVAPILIWSLPDGDPWLELPTSSSLTQSGGPDGVFDPMLQVVQQHREEARDRRILATVLCLALSGLYVAALAIRPSPGAWSYHIFILCLGLGGCTLPFVILLLINWFRPEVQTYFGKITPAASPPTVS